MNTKCSGSILLLFVMILLNNVKTNAQQENWTHFRGSNLNGIAETNNNIPVVFTDTTNVKWKTEIFGRGWSSPVVYGNQIWVTTATTDGKQLYAVCLDFETGSIIHRILLFKPDSIIQKHTTNSYATPTPCIEEGFVYVHFGSLGNACIKTSDGSVVWKRDDFKCDHQQGPGSSPFLYKNLLILHYDGNDVRFLVALNKSNGEVVWRTERPEEPIKHIPKPNRKAYITPILLNVKGTEMLISNGAGLCNAFDPGTGEEIWRLTGGDGGTIAMPFHEKDLVYIFTGQIASETGSKYTELLAFNPDGKGNITGTNIAWKMRAAGLQLLTPVIKDGLIYTIDVVNALMCIDARTSQVIWSSKLRNKFNASPVYNNGNIYFSSLKGEVIVIKEGREMNIVAKNQLDGEIWATPAILRNSILIRTDTKLYKIGF